MSREAIRRIAELMRKLHGARAEEHVLEQVHRWAARNPGSATLAAWIEVLETLDRQARATPGQCVPTSSAKPRPGDNGRRGGRGLSQRRRDFDETQ